MKAPHDAIETSAYLTWMGADGICRTQVKDGGHVVGIKEAKENTKAVDHFFNGTKFPLLIDARNIKSMSKEAREYFSTNGRDTNASAFAIIVKSPVSRVIGNFFISINKPPIPTRLFGDESTAVKWLTKFVRK